MSLSLSSLILLTTTFAGFTNAQDFQGVDCAEECVFHYFQTGPGYRCSNGQAGSYDWECACDDNNFREAYPCCLEQTCSPAEWGLIGSGDVDFRGLCSSAPVRDGLLDLTDCESTDLYYNPFESGYVGSRGRTTSLTSRMSSTTSAESTTLATSATTSETTEEDRPTGPPDSDENNSSTSGSSGSGDNMQLGLGVGLGVGIPLLIIGLAVVYFLFWRTKRKHKTPSEESADADGSTDNRDSTVVGSENWSKSRPMSELPVSPSVGSPRAPSELPSDWGRESMVAYELPAEDKRRSELG